MQALSSEDLTGNHTMLDLALTELTDFLQLGHYMSISICAS
jgi:hypothetical protein